MREVKYTSTFVLNMIQKARDIEHDMRLLLPEDIDIWCDMIVSDCSQHMSYGIQIEIHQSTTDGGWHGRANVVWYDPNKTNFFTNPGVFDDELVSMIDNMLSSFDLHIHDNDNIFIKSNREIFENNIAK